MDDIRKIERIIPAAKVNMGGFIVDQPLPTKDYERIDPFLLIHHANKRFLSESNERDLGVGPHPHRGFSPVTFVFRGSVHHRDSRGNSSIVESGGTQWMHSGLGIIHSERPSKDLAQQGGVMEIIQFWVNVPAKYKMIEPSYTPLTAEETPIVQMNDLVKVSLVAGNLDGVKEKIQTYSPLLVLRIEMKKGAKYELTPPTDFNVLSYQLDGLLKINGQEETRGLEMTVFEKEDGEISFEAIHDTRFILLAGLPIKEPVVAQGPFVMNTDTQILQAIRDYQMGKMGVLVENFN